VIFFTEHSVHCINVDTENLPKFHYEVHHVAHKLGHRTPADVKLRDVSRHAATVTGDDDDDDDEEDRAPAAPAHHVTSGDTLQRSALVDSVGEYNQPVIGLGRGQNDASSLLPADKKLDDEAEQQRTDTDLHVRDSTKNDYYEDYEQEASEAAGEASEAAGQSLARVAPRSSSNNSPSPISDVYFVGNLPPAHSHYARYIACYQRLLYCTVVLYAYNSLLPRRCER